MTINALRNGKRQLANSLGFPPESPAEGTRAWSESIEVFFFLSLRKNFFFLYRGYNVYLLKCQARNEQAGSKAMGREY